MTVTARGKVNAEAIGEGRSPFEIDKALDVEATGDAKSWRGIASIEHGIAAVCGDCKMSKSCCVLIVDAVNGVTEPCVPTTSRVSCVCNVTIEGPFVGLKIEIIGCPTGLKIVNVVPPNPLCWRLRLGAENKEEGLEGATSVCSISALSSSLGGGCGNALPNVSNETKYNKLLK